MRESRRDVQLLEAQRRRESEGGVLRCQAEAYQIFKECFLFKDSFRHSELIQETEGVIW